MPNAFSCVRPFGTRSLAVLLNLGIDGVGVGVGVGFLKIGAELPGVGVGFLEIGAELPGVGAVIGGVGVRVGVGFLKIGAELPGVGAVHTRSCPSLFSANSFFDLVLRGGPS